MSIAKPIKRSTGIIMLCIAVYVLLYMPNSIFGGYWGPVFGRAKWASAVPASTLFLWQPYFGYSDSYEKSLVGWVYLPLILIDQNLIHHQYDITSTNDAAVIFANPSQIRWNPKAEKLARNAYIEKAIWRSHCVEDREFCLQSTKIVHSKDDVHFMALLIYDRYGTNAVDTLKKSISEKSESEFGKKQVFNVIQEMQSLNMKTQ